MLCCMQHAFSHPKAPSVHIAASWPDCKATQLVTAALWRLRCLWCFVWRLTIVWCFISPAALQPFCTFFFLVVFLLRQPFSDCRNELRSLAEKCFNRVSACLLPLLVQQQLSLPPPLDCLHSFLAFICLCLFFRFCICCRSFLTKHTEDWYPSQRFPANILTHSLVRIRNCLLVTSLSVLYLPCSHYSFAYSMTRITVF